MTFVIFLLNIGFVDAQQGNVWVFNKEQGLDFKSGKPIPIFSRAWENGCSQYGNTYSSSVSDCDGKLLIYSSGTKTYNGKHDTITGAVYCQNTTISQANAITGKAIMERKDSVGKYILVYGNPNLNVQLIDMNANGGDGQVYKNMINLSANLFLPITDITNNSFDAFDIQYHPNDSDFWIISRPIGSFFRVIQFSPIYGVKKVIDSYDNRNSFSLQGNNGVAVRFSRNGDLVVAGAHDDGTDPYTAYVYKFDKQTGKINNPLPICDTSVTASNIVYIIDFEFSPNDSLVYISGYKYPFKNYNPFFVTQCKVRGNNLASSGKLLHKESNFDGYLGFSLGTNNKLYGLNYGYASVINDPDKEYPACNFTENVIQMPNGSRPILNKNRQPIHQLFVNNSSSIKEICNDTTWYAIRGDTGYYGNYTLWWGDGDSSIFDNAGLKNVFHIYQNEGNYELVLRALTKQCQAAIWRFDSAFVHFQPHAKLYLDTIIFCEKREIKFQDSIASSKNYEFIIQNINTNDTLLFEKDTTTIYSVSNQSFFKNKNIILDKNDSFLFSLNVSNKWGCKSKDSLIYFPNIDTFPRASITLIGDSSGCRFKEISIQNNALNADSTLMVWGDGNNLSFDNFQNDIKTHIYDSVNTFNPYLIAKNLDNCLDTFKLSQAIKIIGKSKMDYTLTIDSTCQDVKLTIKDNSQNVEYILTLIQRKMNGDTLLYDSATSTGNTLQWTSINKENIDIYRIAKNTFCGDDSLQNQIVFPKQKPLVKIITNPKINNSALVGCAPYSIDFSDSLVNPNTISYSYFVNNVKKQDSILSKYADIFEAGTYKIILKDSANNSCTNIDSIEFTVDSPPIYNYRLALTTLCDKSQITIKTTAKDRIIDSVEIAWESNKKENFIIGNTPEFKTNHTYNFVSKDSARRIYLTTKNINGCIKKDTLDFVQKAYLILSAPNVLGVTVSNINETTLEWIDNPNVNKYEISSSTKGNTITGISPYISKNEPTDKTPISYYINAIDTCGIMGEQSRLSKSILLEGKVVENTIMTDPKDEAVLTWTPYEDWQNGVLNYELQLKDINGIFNTIANFNSNIGYTDTTFYKAELAQYCYRITAEENAGNNYKSNSNIVCLFQKPWLAIPNAFTPNGDGLNDEFILHFLSIKNARVLIINQWGEIVYEYEGNNPKWDGNFKNAPAQIGSYIVQISAQFLSGKKVNYKGIVNLMR